MDAIVCGCTAYLLCCCVRCADWYLLSLVDAMVRGCTTCCVACDVVTDTGTAWKELQRCLVLSQCVLMVPTTSVPGTGAAQYHNRIPCLCSTWYLASLVDAIVCGCTTCFVPACDVLTDTCYLSWMLSCVGVRRVVLLHAMC